MKKVVAAAVLKSLAPKPIDSSKEIQKEDSQLLLTAEVPEPTVIHGSADFFSIQAAS